MQSDPEAANSWETDPREELSWLPAWQVRELVCRGDITALEVLERTLERLAEAEPHIHAYATICEDQARSAAETADSAVRHGKPLGPLHGVPVCIKDEAWVAGVRVSAGSLLFEDFKPPHDGTVAARLKAAGAVIVGMTNVPEFMTWSRTANRLGPETLNPWDTRRSPGASSGGTAASVAAGITPLGIGSDGGGSIRIPAAACGLVGLFPTPGRVPDTGSFSYGRRASLGPLARDVRDIAIAMEVISGADGTDVRASPPNVDFIGALRASVAGMRVAWSADFGHIDADPAVVSEVHSTSALLRDVGVRVDEPNFTFEDAWPWFAKVLRGEVLYEDFPPPYTASPDFVARCLEPQNFPRLMEWNQRALQAPTIERHEYEAAVQWLHRLSNQAMSLLETYDAILSPTLPVVAPILPDGLADPYPSFCCGTYYTSIANLLMVPALSYPAGLVGGMPVGLQIMGRRGREDQILQLAAALETLQPFQSRPSLVAPSQQASC